MRMSGVAPRLRLLLTHDGYELDRSQAQQNTDTQLHGPRPQLGGIDWPLEFFPGIMLTCTWPRGSGVVRATSTRLDVPVTVDGMEIEHRYDASILTRDTAPGEPRRSTDDHWRLNRSGWHAHARAAGVAGGAPPGPDSIRTGGRCWPARA